MFILSSIEFQTETSRLITLHEKLNGLLKLDSISSLIFRYMK